MELCDFENAALLLEKVIKKTPLIKTSLSSKCNVYIKPENLQLTNSFKIRGAYVKICSLSEEERKRGVITCSAGNHAQGIAYACKELGIEAHICMPKATPKIKIDGTKQYGADIILVDGMYDDAYTKAIELQKQFGYTFVHPFNDEKVITGQGTISLEILNELKNVDVILCSVGGGGLISGIAKCAKLINPNVKVYGVEPTGALSMYTSLAKGYRTRLEKLSTIAEGVAVNEVGNLTFEITKKYVDDVLYVQEQDIIDAIKYYYNEFKLITEGAGALPIAAILADVVPNLNKNSNIVCVVSGGNIDPTFFENKILNR